MGIWTLLTCQVLRLSLSLLPLGVLMVLPQHHLWDLWYWTPFISFRPLPPWLWHLERDCAKYDILSWLLSIPHLRSLVSWSYYPRIPPLSLHHCNSGCNGIQAIYVWGHKRQFVHNAIIIYVKLWQADFTIIDSVKSVHVNSCLLKERCDLCELALDGLHCIFILHLYGKNFTHFVRVKQLGNSSLPCEYHSWIP